MGDRASTQDHGALVFLGDSITQGWGDDFRGKFGDVKIANRGISGDTTRGMLVRLADDVIALDPSGVVMLMGTNDIDNGATPETIAGNVKLILAELKEHDPKMPIVLCAVFPSSAEKNRPAEKIRELNRLLAEAVKGDPQVTLVDTWTLFANADGDAKLEEFPDLLHPNDAGYAKWAAALRPILATLGFLETEADDFTPEPGFESAVQRPRSDRLGRAADAGGGSQGARRLAARRPQRGRLADHHRGQGVRRPDGERRRPLRGQERPARSSPRRRKAARSSNCGRRASFPRTSR